VLVSVFSLSFGCIGMAIHSAMNDNDFRENGPCSYY